MDYDPTDWNTQIDPYPTYRWLRDEVPCFYNEELDFWAISRFEDVWAATLDLDALTTEGIEEAKALKPMLNFLDPPRHDQLRALVSRAFTFRRVQEMEPRIRSLAGELSDSEIESRLQRLECLKVHPRDESENRALMARLEQCYAMALGHEREHLQDLLTELEALIERQDRNLLSDFRDQLGAYLDAFEDGYVS